MDVFLFLLFEKDKLDAEANSEHSEAPKLLPLSEDIGLSRSCDELSPVEVAEDAKEVWRLAPTGTF